MACGSSNSMQPQSDSCTESHCGMARHTTTQNKLQLLLLKTRCHACSKLHTYPSRYSLNKLISVTENAEN